MTVPVHNMHGRPKGYKVSEQRFWLNCHWVGSAARDPAGAELPNPDDRGADSKSHDRSLQDIDARSAFDNETSSLKTPYCAAYLTKLPECAILKDDFAPHFAFRLMELFPLEQG